MTAVTDVLNAAATNIEASRWDTTTAVIVIGWCENVPGHTKAEVAAALRAAAGRAS